MIKKKKKEKKKKSTHALAEKPERGIDGCAWIALAKQGRDELAVAHAQERAGVVDEGGDARNNHGLVDGERRQGRRPSESADADV